MVRRPWPIVVMAFVHVLVLPIFYHFLSSYMFGLSLYEYHQQLTESGFFYTAISRFILLPIAGAAIYITKRWSYYIFVLTMIAVVICNILEHNANPTNASFNIFLIVTCINIICVSYFFVPSVSRVYHDKNIRWWEQAKRYKVNIPAKIKTDKGDTIDCVIENISTSGAKLKAENVDGSNTLILEFKDSDYEFKINFDLVRSFKESYGIRFFHDNKSKIFMRKYIKYLIKNGAQPKRKLPPWYESFLDWAKNLITKGKGFTPEK